MPDEADKRSGGRSSLTRRLTTTFLLTTLLILTILSLMVYLATVFYLNDRLETELDDQADFYATYAASLALDERMLAGLAPTIVDLFAPQAGLNVRFFSIHDGTLLAATQDIGPQPSRVALVQLRYRSPTLFTQPSQDLPHRHYTACPVMSGGRAIGVVEVSRSTLESERFLATLRAILLVAILVAAVVAGVVSTLLARRLSRPIRQVERATRQIAAGDLTVRVGTYPPDEIGELARSVDRMAERLGELEEARTRFIGEISHDLRTPLAGVKGMLVNLIDAVGPDRLEERNSLEVAGRETDRLIRLVNQLLDFARWQGGHLRLDRQPVDVTNVARDAVVLVEGRARHRNVALRVEIPQHLPPLLADPDRLQRVLLNLLDNAIAFTPAGGQVTLQVEGREGQIEISVRDTGRGMTDAEMARVFEPYYRGEKGGTGLGLAIARAIVEAHGGQIGIESQIDRGTRVWFFLLCNNC